MMLPFLIILATCVAGVLHAPWWAALAGACGLMLYSLTAHRHMHAGIPEPIVIASSAINGVWAAGGAFVFGIAARWFWGL